MPKQLRPTRTSRGRRQATSAATSKRPYTRCSQPNAPAATNQNPPGKETRPLTTDDIATIVQQVTATLKRQPFSSDLSSYEHEDSDNCVTLGQLNHRGYGQDDNRFAH